MSDSPPPSSDVAERTIGKITRRLVTLLFAVYIVNYLDRVNIAFAGPNGMNAELALTATTFGLVSGIFFIGYLFLEVPSNLILYRVGARRWISRIMASWGIISTLCAFAPNLTILLLLRFLLGVAESGFFPGIILYLSFWFPAEKRAQAVSWFMLALPTATAIGAPLSTFIIQNAEGLFGLSGWRAMFLIEGLPAIAFAAVAYFRLSDRPDDAKWLADDERQWLTQTIASQEEKTPEAEQWTTRRSLTHPRIIVLCLIDFALTYGLYALGFFLPTIIAGFRDQYGIHISITTQGLLTAVPYVFGAAAMFIWARRSDRTGKRHLHIALPMIVGGIAIPIALHMQNPVFAIAAITICTMGVCAALPAFWALPSQYLPGVAAASGLAAILRRNLATGL